MTDELADIDTALGLLRALRAEVAAERQAFEGKRLTRQNYLHPAKLDSTLVQIDNGVHRDDGVDPRLWALINQPAIARFKLRAPGIRSLRTSAGTDGCRRGRGGETGSRNVACAVPLAAGSQVLRGRA